MPLRPKAALIEFGTSHVECLYSQYLFLSKSGYEVSIIANSELVDQVSELSSCRKQLVPIKNGYFRNRKSYQTLNNFLRSEGIKKVIVNTASGINVSDFLFSAFPSDMQFIGVIHDTEKLKRSFTQRLIRLKIKKYFVLNDYIVNTFAGESSFRVESFYPIFFPEYTAVNLEKKDDEFWVSVPGLVESVRRDYDSLLANLERHRIDPDVRFILLGSSGHSLGSVDEIRNRVSEINLTGQFVTFEEFIPNDLFHSYIEKSDIILPLIHPSRRGFQQFKHFKISGSFNLAFAHRKPLLCDEEFKIHEDFRENAFFYSGSDMVEVINRLAEDRMLIENKQLYKNSKWNFEFQRKKYIQFIGK